MKKKMAILVWALYGGGAERIAGLLSKRMSKYYDIYLFLIDTSKITYDYSGTIVDIGYSWPFFNETVRKLKKELKIDISVSFLENMNMCNIASSIGEKVIVSERCSHSSMRPRYYSDDYIISKWYPYADGIVACSEGVKYELKEYFGINTPICSIYNFIDKELILRKSNERFDDAVEDFLNGEEYYISVGRLHKQKRHIELIKQFSKYLYYHRVNEKLIILGSGGLINKLNDQIMSEGMENNIRIFPYDENPFRYMKKANALICTSYCEGFPNVMMESFLVGTPVIAVDCLSGPKEILNDDLDYSKFTDINKLCKRGILMPNKFNDRKILSDAINMFKENNGKDGFSDKLVSYMDSYDNSNIEMQWLNFIEDIPKRNLIIPDDMETLNNADHIWIYGAGTAAKSIYKRFSRKNIDGFVITDGRETSLFGLPVIRLNNLRDKAWKYTFLMGTTNEEYRNEIVGNLKKVGANNILYL